MSVSLFAASLNGINSNLVEVEIHISRGLPAFYVVGLGDTAVHESKERVRSAIINSNFTFPSNHKTINLAPADTKKQGPIFDLAMALGLLIDSDQLCLKDLKRSLFVGELALNGSVKSVNGAMVIAHFAKKHGFKNIYLPQANVMEAKIVRGINIIGVDHLLNFKDSCFPHTLESAYLKSFPATESEYDFSLIKGQKYAKRALEIAAAGRHHVLFVGNPGCGKTLLSRTFSSILPALDFEEQLEVSSIYSVLGMLKSQMPLVLDRPFREVHHTASAVSIVGGGQHPKPGEISLAHKGALFLDEIAEFPRHVLETLRQPLESKTITVHRAASVCRFPADFQLIAAMNPCPCGWYGHAKKECKCSMSVIENYKKRLSGPLLDRIDMIIKMSPLAPKESLTSQNEEASFIIQERVNKAFLLQKERYKNEKFNHNAGLSLKAMKKYIQLTPDAEKLLQDASNNFDISMRGINRTLKLALTIANLDGQTIIKEEYLAEALSYRDC